MFHGALLNADSDPTATPLAILPAADLFAQFQRQSKIIYMTGDSDTANLDADISSRQSMSAWCVVGTSSETMFKTAHEAVSGVYLDRALRKLQTAWTSNTDQLTTCGKTIAAEVAARLQGVRDRLQQGKTQDALKELRAIDLRYGSLAAPESLDLYRRINPAT